MTPAEANTREAICLLAKSLFDRGYGCGSSGNVSVLTDDGMIESRPRIGHVLHSMVVAGAETLSDLVAGDVQTEPRSGRSAAPESQRRERVPTELVYRRPSDALEVVLAERLRDRPGCACYAV